MTLLLQPPTQYTVNAHHLAGLSNGVQPRLMRRLLQYDPRETEGWFRYARTQPFGCHQPQPQPLPPSLATATAMS